MVADSAEIQKAEILSEQFKLVFIDTVDWM